MIMNADLDPRIDRLYSLLPAVYRQRDAENGYVLQALLRVIAEQVNVVEDDIAQLYDNWFIETCQDWVVPYIGDLIGYRLVHEAGEPGDVTSVRGRQRNKILIPRRDVANTIRYRRRKGTLALLELLANDVAGWPARAVELYTLLGWTQHLDHQRPTRGRTADLRDGDALDRLDGPFDGMAHTVDVRSIASCKSQGRYNIPSVAVFVWRLKSYSVTRTPAYCLDELPHCYTFSVLGNDTPLYNRLQPEPEPTHIAGELNVPAPIRRRRFESHLGDYYEAGKSVEIWLGEAESERKPEQPRQRQLIESKDIVVADLKDWVYQPRRGTVAVDPERGRIAFPPGHAPLDRVVWVSYQYAFSADIGGGEYRRLLSQPAEHVLYRVGEGEKHASIGDALDEWKQEHPRNAVIEITDSGLYEERLAIHLDAGQSLQLRAASGKRPVIGLSNQRRALVDALRISGGAGSRLTLDGLLIVGRPVQVAGPEVPPASPVRSARRDDAAKEAPRGDLAELIIRHSTLVPGWMLDCDCEPQQPAKPSLELRRTQARVTIEHSILGSIQVIQDEVTTDPIQIRISDSILDATSPEREALDAPGYPVAHAVLTIARSTVIGCVQTHAIELAENCIFHGLVRVARRQQGCMRFCYVPPGSRTPRRYECQPDKAVRAIKEELERRAGPAIAPEEIDAAQERERHRVRPQFNSTRYGIPAYCQLAHSCAEEITRGADDESEMGAFHDLFNPQREANLRARLDEYTPAGMEAGIIFAT
jgi:hypothetical protein